MLPLVDTDLETLREQLSGQVIVPGDAEYDTARRIWNGDIDRSPAIIVRVGGTADVVACLAFVRAHELDFSVRGGGHNFGGTSLCDGLVIDLGALRQITVDVEARTVRVGGGATNADLDAATQEHGLAVPAGTVSDTGIGGLALGGGFGWLTAKHGLSVDNLLSAEVVLADGQVVRASADEHPDLFWALRGGGGNFGVVTEFEFRVHPVGPLVNLAMFFWDIDQGAQALRHIRKVAATLPEGVGMVAYGMTVLPTPFIPEEHHDKVGYSLTLAGFGTAQEHAELAASVRAGLPPRFEFVTPIPYVDLQKMADAGNYPGVFAYEKSIYATELTDEFIDVLVATLPDRASPLSGTALVFLRGAYSEVDEDATAFGGSRKPCFMVTTTAVCPTPELLELDRVWSRSTWEKIRPFASNVGGYVNMMTDYEQDRVRSTYGSAKYDRLAGIKAVYDPDNMFHHNANVKPASD